MRTAPPGQAGLTPMGPQAQARTCALDQEISPQTVTSHSLTLATKAFCLDFTWRRVETDQPAKRPAIAAPASSATAGAPAAVQYDRQARTSAVATSQPATSPATPARAPRQSFAEVLRRQQLAGLVLMPSRPPADRLTLLGPLATADPQPGPVCRAYAEAQGAEALGPLGAASSRCYTV
jgi:hypothetical protein